MRRKSALKLRQEFGAVLDQMSTSGAQPIIIDKNSVPVAVLISYEDYLKRYFEEQSSKDRENLLERFRVTAKPSKISTTDLLRDIRYNND